MSDHDSDHEEEQEPNLSSSDVVTKYKSAAEIANRALKEVIAGCKDGARVVELCEKGDSTIRQAVGNIFKGKAIEKGVAFPTCVSVNNCVGNFSPPAEDQNVLKEGDVVKIDLGAHIDGFIATAAHTLVVQGDASAPVSGRAADVIAATNTGLEAAMRLIRPGKSVADVAPVLQKVVESFGCSLVEGVISHQHRRFVMDTMEKCVLNKPSHEAHVEDSEFEENEVYGIDIVVSTGEGKARVLDDKQTTIYKRDAGATYHLKMKASRALIAEVAKKFNLMAFTTRALEGPAGPTRLGIVECLNHDMLLPYPVLYEKPSELVAQFKATVLLMPNGSDRITSAPLQTLQTDKQVEDPEVKKLLQSSLKPKKKKPAAKKEAAPAEVAAS